MLEQWTVFLEIMLEPHEKYPLLYNITVLMDAADTVRTMLRSKAQYQPDMPSDLTRLIKDNFN